MPTPPDFSQPETADTVASTGVPERRRPLKRGAVVGRYVVIDRAGEGGMGVVYKAYDPERERAVALKLLHAGPKTGDDAERRQARLLREAKALARLSHPNVVAVHDVGTYEGDVFLATEFVEGAPLKSWLLVEKPARKEVLRVMIAAGEGLAAAHGAGLVHRDVKPGNLHVGKDGRVRVIDFGLARTDVSEDATRDDIVDPPPSSNPASLEGPLTRIGHVVGTPRYMAPEQHEKSAVDARSDQFSFCATLYEALYGEPPFEAGDDDYKSSKKEGRVRAAPEGSHVPKHLRQILLRGLAPKPEDRWPSMDALLVELRRDPAAKRRRVLVVVGAVAAAGVVAGAAMLWSPVRAPPLCTGSEARLAGVWDGPARRAVEAAFAATGREGAGAAAARVERVLDAYAQGWAGERKDACLATKARGEQSEELLDLRMECYDDRLRELGAQVKVLTHADAAALDRASQAAGTLTPLEGCANAAALRAPIRPPSDAGARDRVEGVRARLAEGRAKQRVSSYAEARGLAAGAVEDAAAIGYRPLEAEALFLLGDIDDDLGDYKAAEATMVRASSAALAGHHDEVLARSLTALVAETGLRQARFDDAHRWEALARAAADRGSAFVQGEERRNAARVLLREGKLAEARAQTEECLALWRPALGDDAYPIAGALTDLGNAYFEEGDYARATDTYEKSIAVLEKTVGPDSPSLGPNLNNLGEVATHMAQYDRALAALERALSVWTRGLGPAHPKVALATYNLGEVWRRRGDPQRAIPEYRKALAIDESALGPDSPETAYPVEGLADAALAMGDAKSALPLYERALTIREKTLGPTHAEVATTLTGLARAKLALGDRQAAIPLLKRALTIRTTQPGDPADLASTREALESALRTH